MRKKKGKGLCIFILVFFSVITVAVACFAGAIFAISKDVTLNKDMLKNGASNVKTFSSNGEALSTSFDYVMLQQCPAHLKNAFISTEDKRFYSHKGIDIKRIFGAAFYDIKNRSLSQGASTITCQLAKNTQLSAEKTFTRKIKEAKLAVDLEKAYSKDEILEMYLNIIYFGSGIYGVGNAALSYFGKKVSELNLAECASLAAVAAAPAKYSPLINYDNNNNRKNTVLRLMHEQGYITDSEYQQTISEKVKLNGENYAYCSLYSDEAVKQACKLLNITEAEIKQSGYSVYTYCVKEEQKKAYDATHGDLIPLGKDGYTSASSLIVCNPQNGGVTAYSANHSYSPFDLQRQPGSLIKPFIYASAMDDRKLLPASIINDEPTCFGDFMPKDSGDYYRGKISARDALAYSSNVCAVKVLDYVGLDKAVETLCEYGIQVKNADKNYALALGGMTYGATLSQICNAYCVFANGGHIPQLSFIKEIKDSDGNTIYKNPQELTHITDSKTTTYINDCLLSCAEYGTAKKLCDFNSFAAKTGTVEQQNGNSDCWCVAYNSDRVCCAWLGNLSMKKESMLDATGGGACALLIRNGVIASHATPAPVTEEKVAIDLLSLQRDGIVRLATDNTPQRYTVMDYAGDNTEVSTYFDKAEVDFSISSNNENITIEFEALPECDYRVELANINGEKLIDHISGQNGTVNISTKGEFGFNQVNIYPAVNGRRRLEGTPMGKPVFCFF